MRRRLAWLGVIFLVGTFLGCAPTPERRSTGEFIDDAAIVAKVKAKLAADPLVSVFRIGVDSRRGVVTLWGEVDTRTQERRAVEDAQSVGGVKRVVSEIVVREASQAPPPASP